MVIDVGLGGLGLLLDRRRGEPGQRGVQALFAPQRGLGPSERGARLLDRGLCVVRIDPRKVARRDAPRDVGGQRFGFADAALVGVGLARGQTQ